MGEAQKCVAELDVDEVFIGCLLWLLVFWCLVKGIGALVEFPCDVSFPIAGKSTML